MVDTMRVPVVPLAYVFRALVLALAWSGLSLVLDRQLKTETGLTLTFFRDPGFSGDVLVQHTTPVVDLSVLERNPELPRRFFSIRWTGVWHVRNEGTYELHLGADDTAVLKIDGNVVLERNPEVGLHTVSKPLALSAGFHTIDVDYEQYAGGTYLNCQWAVAGEVPRPLAVEALFPSIPDRRSLRINTLLRALRRGLLVMWLAVLGTLVLLGGSHAVTSIGARRDRWRGALARFADRYQEAFAAVRRIASRLAAGLPILVVLYATALRFDALSARYGPLDRPPWAHQLDENTREWISLLRPQAFGWAPVADPHGGDPINYIRFGREMEHFYDAHVREPVFPFVSSIFLKLLNQQDVAVSFASAVFSLLGVAATYLLGSYAFSRWVGLGAALAMAIERDVISWGVNGWRDDAFTFFVVVSAYGLLRCHRSGSYADALLAGIVAGFSCLTRLTSLSFLLPGFAFLIFTSPKGHLKRRLGTVATALLTTTAITAPYLINCWITYGDPLFAINYHTQFYQAREGLAPDTSVSAVHYVGTKLLDRPFATLDTVAVGLTSYPFSNKWTGFDPWLPGLGLYLSWSALVGLTLCLWSGAGRLLLLVLVTSLLPYAFTWSIPGGSEWRFTQHAYPFFLVASCLTIRQVGGAMSLARWGWRSPAPATRRRVSAFVGVLAAIAVAWGTLQVLPYLKARESLLAGDPATIMAGDRDGVFFASGWSAAITDGNVTARPSQGQLSILRLPLPPIQDYALTIRLDPYDPRIDARPRKELPPSSLLRSVRVFVNNTLVAKFVLRWDPNQFGSCDVKLSRTMLKNGLNSIALLADLTAPVKSVPGGPVDSSETVGRRFRLWYVMVQPIPTDN